jgi:hypothetical protein
MPLAKIHVVEGRYDETKCPALWPTSMGFQRCAATAGRRDDRGNFCFTGCVPRR